MIPMIDKKETGIQLRKIMDQYGVSVKDVQKYLGLGSVQSVYHWLNGISMPTVDNLYALSELFQVSMDELVCGNRDLCKKSNSTTEMDWHQYRMFGFYHRMREKQAA